MAPWLLVSGKCRLSESSRAVICEMFTTVLTPSSLAATATFVVGSTRRSRYRCLKWIGRGRGGYDHIFAGFDRWKLCLNHDDVRF